MSNAPIEVVVAAFDGEEGAEQALAKLKAAEKEKLISIKNAAVLRRDENSNLHVKETADMTGTRGAAYGGIAGAVLGVITGPVGWAALGGAAIGGLVAKLRDSGFKNERLEQWGANLTPGSSAVVAVIEHTWVDQVKEMLREGAKDVLSLAIAEDIAAQLESRS